MSKILMSQSETNNFVLGVAIGLILGMSMYLYLDYRVTKIEIMIKEIK
jgi:hypothetical protein